MLSRLSSFAAATALAACSAAHAQDVTRDMLEPAQGIKPAAQADQNPDEAQTDQAADEQSKAAAEKKKSTDLLVVPIPLSNPATGSGGVLAGVLFYNPNGEPHPWITGVGGGYMSSGTWGGGLFHSMSLGHDKIRLLGFVGYGDAQVKFYGIGPDAGANGEYVKLEDKALIGMVDGQVRFFREGFLNHLYFGARFLYLNIDSSVAIPHPNRPDLQPPALELRSAVSEIGPSFTFDSRDKPFGPRTGLYVTGTLLFGAKFLGSDFDHHKLQFAANAYFPLGKNTVVAVRQSLCGTSGKVPYYDLCMFGQQGDLRGYETGRYRDGASWAVQAELRQHLFGKFGVVGFAGVGGIADGIDEILDHSTVLASGGVGLRYLASKSNNVNLRLDVAWGKDGRALYFGIGESF